ARSSATPVPGSSRSRALDARRAGSGSRPGRCLDGLAERGRASQRTRPSIPTTGGDVRGVRDSAFRASLLLFPGPVAIYRNTSPALVEASCWLARVTRHIGVLGPGAEF